MSAKILIVEDDFVIGLDMQTLLEAAGIETIGPVGTPQDALHRIAHDQPKAAFVDGNLNGQMAVAVAHGLRERSIPFAFVTGYSREHLPPGFNDVPIVRKPFDSIALIETARALLSRQR